MAPTHGILTWTTFFVVFGLLAAAAPAQAASQNWYLVDNTTASPALHAGSTTPSPNINASQARTWTANVPAAVSVDLSGTWTYSIHLAQGGSAKPNTFSVDVGKVGASGFVAAGSATISIASNQKLYTGSIPVANLLIAPGESLAFRVFNIDDPGSDSAERFTVTQNSAQTFFGSPASDPGYPTPELASFVLVGAGAVAMAAFAVIRRR